MTMKRDLEESCVLVADLSDTSYTYNVAIEEIAEAQKTIKATFDLFDKPCKRVYISGFTLVSKNTNLSKESIIARVASMMSMGNKEKENSRVLSINN